MRRPWVVLVALAALMLAAAPAAYAQEPTITTDITFPEEGEPFGPSPPPSRCVHRGHSWTSSSVAAEHL